MSTYVVECSCGHDLKVEAPLKISAIQQMKEMMDAKGIRDHYAQYHPGEEVPSVVAVHEQIEQSVHEVATV